jgi:hypothetical protein
MNILYLPEYMMAVFCNSSSEKWGGGGGTVIDLM